MVQKNKINSLYCQTLSHISKTWHLFASVTTITFRTLEGTWRTSVLVSVLIGSTDDLAGSMDSSPGSSLGLAKPEGRMGWRVLLTWAWRRNCSLWYWCTAVEECFEWFMTVLSLKRLLNRVVHKVTHLEWLLIFLFSMGMSACLNKLFIID